MRQKQLQIINIKEKIKMKRTCTFLAAALLTATVFAHSHEEMSDQTVTGNSNNQLLTSQQETTLLKSSSSTVYPTLRFKVNCKDFSDEIVFAIREGSDYCFEAYDTQKRFGSIDAEIFFELKCGEMLAVNCIPEIPDTGTVRIGLKARTEGEYCIEFHEYVDFPEDQEIYFDDLATGYSEQVKQGMVYKFDTEEITTSERFQLRFGEPELISTGICREYTDWTPELYSYGNMIRIQSGDLAFAPAFLKVYDLHGKEVMTRQLEGNSDYSIPTAIQTGIYIIHIQSGGKQYSKKIFLNE